MSDLIDRSALPTMRIEIPERIDDKTCRILEGVIRGVQHVIDSAPAVDAVPRGEYDALLRRFQHLLQSDCIRSFDEYDPRTQTYKRNITEADAILSPVRCKDCVHYDNTPYDWIGPRYCECLGCYRQSNFYCAYGKKRPGND